MSTQADNLASFMRAIEMATRSYHAASNRVEQEVRAKSLQMALQMFSDWLDDDVVLTVPE